MKVLQVGCTVWTFDTNRRVYGDGRGGPLFRGYFEEHTIVAQTRVSWILDNEKKFPKKDAELYVYTTEQAVEDAVWLDLNREHIVDAIRRRDRNGSAATTLREVARLLGVAAAPEPETPKRYRRDGPCLVIG